VNKNKNHNPLPFKEFHRNQINLFCATSTINMAAAARFGRGNRNTLHNTRNNKRVRVEEDDPVVQAVAWCCAVCDLRQSTGATLATPSKSKRVDPVKAKRNARKLAAKINAEKDDSDSDVQHGPPEYTVAKSFLCEAEALLEVQVAKSNRGGRPVGPRPNLYAGSDTEWRSLTCEQRKAVSKKLKRSHRSGEIMLPSRLLLLSV